MAYLRSLPDRAVLRDVFAAFPQTSRPLLDYHQALLRGPSPFSVAERELIAAYVSGLNACDYCHGVHTATAQAFGVDEGLVAALLDEVDAAPVDARMRPVLRYVGKLTLTPSRMAAADAEAVLAAGVGRAGAARRSLGVRPVQPHEPPRGGPGRPRRRGLVPAVRTAARHPRVRGPAAAAHGTRCRAGAEGR
jgi:AhpD family alkylhydroperoxidase